MISLDKSAVTVQRSTAACSGLILFLAYSVKALNAGIFTGMEQCVLKAVSKSLHSDRGSEHLSIRYETVN